MKKLLGIVVLGLLLSGNAYSKEMVLKCEVIFFFHDGEEITPMANDETIIINPDKKYWKRPNTKKGKEDFLIIKDNLYGNYYVSNYSIVSGGVPYISIGYETLNRYDGDLISVDAQIPEIEGKKIQKLSKKRNHFKAFEEIKKVGLSYYKKFNEGMFVKKKCSKSKKLL